MILGDSRKIFDLTQENDALRDRYGRNTFGQSCLMARRLVEQGVPYVTINYKGWDTHKQHFEIMPQAAGTRRRLRHAASGSIRPRPAGKHRRLVGRRVRPHAEVLWEAPGTAVATISETVSARCSPAAASPAATCRRVGCHRLGSRRAAGASE
jgi:hypothetical protein